MTSDTQSFLDLAIGNFATESQIIKSLVLTPDTVNRSSATFILTWAGYMTNTYDKLFTLFFLPNVD